MSFLDRYLWERKYVDLWTIVHIFNGMSFGFSIFFYHSPFLESFVTFTIFTIIWEIIEFYTNAKEPLTNQIMDVLTGVLGFLATYKTVPIFAPDLTRQIIYFTIVYTITWTFAYFGFQSFALHFNRDVKKYGSSFIFAGILYVIIFVLMFLF